MHRTTRLVAAAAAGLLTVALAPAALGDKDDRRDKDLSAVGLVAPATLVTFDLDKPGKTRPLGEVALAGDARLVGIDYRVQNGELYGVGDKGGIYLIDDRTAAATRVGQLTVGLVGDEFAVDFNPAANALRILSDTGQNLRQPFTTGDTATAPTATDGALTYPAAGATPSAPAPGVTGAAYTNNDLLATTATTLFDLDTVRDQVVVQSPANSGQVQPTGQLGLDTGPRSGFDVYSTIRGGRTVANDGYAVLQSGASQVLAAVDVLDGQALVRGAFDRQVVDLAIPLDQRRS